MAIDLSDHGFRMMLQHRNDVLLTGVPRSGTTLCCALLNRNPDVLALAEPMRIPEFEPEAGVEAACARIATFMRETRSRALAEHLAPTLQRDGQIVDNPIAERRADDAPRPRVARLGDIAVERDLPEDFRLVVKHNALFTALLPALIERFTVYAVVRDPLAVLASWNSVDLPVRDGHVPAGELYDATLNAALAAEPDRLARQMRMLDWFFDRILQSIPTDRIIRYEELVDGKSAAAQALGVVPALTAERSQNRNHDYPRELLDELAMKLDVRSGAWRRLYPGSA